MRNSLPSLPCARFAREALGVALPLLLGAGLFALLPGMSPSQGGGESVPPKAGDPALCGEWHRGAGETRPLDLASVKQAYDELRGRVAKSLDRVRAEAIADLDRPYDSGLPACRAESARTEWRPRAELAGLRGKVLYFVSVADPARLNIPSEVAGDPAAQIVVVRVDALKDLPAIARVAGRPVTLGSAELARALGVRCAGTWLRISEKGDAVELHESR